MSGEWPRLAPVPFTPMSRSTDWIASTVFLLALGIVVSRWIVRHTLAELALNRESDQPCKVDEPVDVDR